jgi:hypothetical protein
MNRGVVIHAQNTNSINYVECAEVLARSITRCMPNLHLSLLTDDIDSSPYFDKVIALPYGDLDPASNWKLVNDWQVYEASPYDYTIKLEADLYITRSFDHWWDILSKKDVVISTTIRNFKQEVSNSRYYRKFIDDNKLPDVYNAITYFKKSELAESFFNIVKDVFDYWPEYKKTLKCNVNEECSTDWAYAIACHILGVENTTLPNFNDMSMVHMKKHINNLQVENWQEVLVYEISKDMLKINSYPQLYPFHYHVKNFSKKLVEVL